MKIYNLHLEHNVNFKYGKPQARIICSIDAKFTDVREFWFSVNEEYASLLTPDSYDAFLVALLYPAMFYHEDIEIEGNVTKKLVHNISHYIQSIVLDYNKTTRPIKIRVKGYNHATKAQTQHIGTGFSGGVDSFATLTDNYFNEDDPEYKIDSLFFFHLGQYGHGYNNPDNWKRANQRFEITKRFYADAFGNLGAKGYCLMMNTNLFSFIPSEWEFDAGIFFRIASVLVFQRVLKRYYISDSDSYAEICRKDFSKQNEAMTEFESVIMPLLSPKGLEILCDGAQRSRTQKTELISTNAFAQKYLNVCVTNSYTQAENCCICSKCKRTLFALESTGNIEKFSKVFDLNKWQKEQFHYKCECICNYNSDSYAKDNVDYALAMGNKLPSKFVAYSEQITFKLVHRLGHIIKVIIKNPHRIIEKLQGR